MQSITVIVEKTQESGGGYERDPDGDGWYQRGSRIWFETSEKIHSIHSSMSSAKKVVSRLKNGITKKELADQNDSTSPIEYIEQKEYRVERLSAGSPWSPRS